MVDIKDLIDVVVGAVEKKQRQLHDEINKRGWRGLRAESTQKAINMLRCEEPEVKEEAKRLYDNISGSKKPLENYRKRFKRDHLTATKMYEGVNAYLLDSIFWSSVSYIMAEHFYDDTGSTQRTIIVTECLMTSLEILSEAFGLGVYSCYSEDIDRLNRQRENASKKGGDVRRGYYIFIKKKACELILEHKPILGKWKNKTEAAKGIEEDLWHYISIIQHKNPKKIDLKEESLIQAILRWSRDDNEVREAMEKYVNIRKKK